MLYASEDQSLSLPITVYKETSLGLSIFDARAVSLLHYG